LTSNVLYGFISQKRLLFIITAARISNPTQIEYSFKTGLDEKPVVLTFKFWKLLIPQQKLNFPVHFAELKIVTRKN
jgi:hypothetical protein